MHEFNPSQKQIKIKIMIIMIRKQNEKENCWASMNNIQTIYKYQ